MRFPWATAEEERLRQLLVRLIREFVTDPQKQKELLGLVYSAGEHELNDSLEGITDTAVSAED